uniref:HECT-type E3 ubiquitin transferase n=3 Tax=Phytophthora fragariae TaxID=53985 RepID=A0A6A3FWH7_9STRA|nr:hypothetical protein PF009_g4320 [Phytophthora fragariae]
MESAAPSRSGGRKRRGGGKRKRSGGRNSENEERKTQDPPAQQQEAEEEKGEKEKEDKNKKEKEEKEEEDKEEKPPTHWSCEACTFLNEASRCFCEMCETPNPSPPAASARALTGASEWSCAACTMVNPAAMRVCGVCGTLNPRPPAGLSIVRLSQALGDESLSSASSDDSDEDDSDDSDDEEEEDDEAEDTWICRNCDALAAGRTCSNCFAQRPKIARKSAKAAELEKKSKEERKQALMKKRKRRKREKKLQERARMAYGVSIYELKKLVLEPTSSRLVDTLQTLTHTLAMMDASADNEWGDGPSFLMRGFGAGPSSDTAKDPELLTVLADIFRGKERTYPVEVRQLAVQAISYLMRMDRHMFARSKMVEVVGLYITDLLAWKKDGTSDVSSGNAKSAQMIVEECLSGLSSMCSTEAFALRELLADGHFVGYLDFLTRLVDGDEEKDGGFHPSILMTALGILQKGCMKLRWGGKPGQRRGSHGNVNVEKPSVSRAASPKKVTQESQLTLELAVKLVSFLRHVLEHKHIPLHVKASKCLLLLFHRAPHNRPEVMEKLVTPDVLRKFVAVVVNANNESEESRLAMVSLLLHLFENRARLVNMFVREKIYAELFSGMLPLLQSSSTALRAHALKLTAMLARVVCRKHSLGFSNSSCHKSMDESSVNGSAVCSPQNRHNRHRLNSLPDPDVLSKLLLDFIRADSIPAVNVLLKDGADLNFPKMLDLQGNEIDKPLNVAVQCASLGMVRLLLKRGADIHQVGIGGTALHVAAKTGRCDVATFLLQCGARVQARDRENKTVMNVINSLKDYALSGDGAGRVPSPMAKLLELHQRAPGMRDYESDLSESDGMSGGRSQAWFYPSDHDDEYGDEDEMDDDDLEGEENYYMNYNDDEDEGVDEDMGDESMSSDGDMVYYDDEMSSEVAPSRQHRHGSTASGSETKFENAGQDTGESNMTLTRRGRTSSGEKDLQGDNTELEQKGFTLTPEEAYDFCFAITQCLLAVLHDMDIQNVERSVISTVACVLEMAPSRLIRVLKEVDVVLILDTVHFLLQGEKHRLSSSDPTSMEVTAATPTSLTSATDTTRTGTAPTAPNSNLPSFILAVRILQAMIRKSAKESSIFHQIERRGISEQIEQLNDASACWISTSFGEGSSNSRDTIFGRGLDLLKSLRADMLESGMLHLHKLRNLARRLKEFTDSSSSYEKDLILVDLVDLFEQPNSITTYEFKQSELLPAILQYLSPQGELDEARALALMRAFERCPSALKNLIFRLQSIITQEETFPLVSFNTGKGKELFPLTRQLKIAFMRPGDRNAGARPHRGTAGRPKGKSIHSSPLTHFQSFERTIARCMPVIDSDLSSLYLNLVGHSIQKVVEGKWRKFLVVGYDDTRSHHLVKPIGGSNDDLAEMVIHDSQCKLIGNVDVYESISLDLALFGSPDTVDNGGSSQDNKKKRKPNKRKRKSSGSSGQKLQRHDSDGACHVEVKNSGMLKMSRLPGAWYAAELVDDSGEVRKLGDGKHNTCEDVLAGQTTHSVRLLAENRIIRKVPSDCLRPRTLQPQVGSVVEVDGALGEVTRVYNSDGSPSSTTSTTNRLVDVKVSSDIEKSRVKKDRVHFPPHEKSTPKPGGDSGRIEAMSIRRLFPARDSSLLAGSAGDSVWVLPPSGSPIKDLCVAGKIKSFPSGLESIPESSTVLVEISFGSTQPPLTVKVNQDRVLNFSKDGGALSGRGPSRLLAALQMASGRGGASRLFDGERGGQDSTSAIHRAFERVAGSLQQNRLGGGQRPSSSAMDHLRNLISRSSAFNGSNGSNDVDTPSEQAPRIAQDSGSNSPPNDLIGSEAQAEEETPAPALSASTKAAGQHKSPTNGSSCETPALQTYLKPVGAKPKLTCTQLPKVNLVVGFRKCDASTAAQDRIIVSSEFGLQRLGRSKINNDMPQAPLLIQLNRSTQRFEATPGARKALLNVFNTFSGNTGSGSSQKKKRRKLSPVAQRKTDLEGTPWDIDKFIAFMMILRGPAKYGHPGSNAKYCVVFSKFADPDTNRSLLKADGFISLMVHECKDDAKSKQLLKFLRSRGYSEKSLTYSVSRSSSRDDDEEKDSPSGSDSGGAKAASTSGNNTLRQPGVLRGFPGDQNVLKCVEDLRQEYRARAGGNNGLSSDTISSVDATLPPWKLTYKLYCDFQVEWETQPPSNPNTTIADAESLESLAALESKTPTRLLSHGIVALDCLHANGATDASRWLSRITDSQAGSRDGIAVPKSVASAVRLLRYLFEFRADSTSLDESLWASPRLYNKLETQMQDVLSMCSGIYPPWCDTLVTHCKFFFPRELREKLFRSTSFGCTRSLHWFRSQLNIEESSADSTSSMVGGGLYNQEISISPIPKERVKVHRENILQSAEAVMKMHAKRKAILDVVFVGEKGYGSGVTAAFYSTTAHALQSVVENQTNRYWIPGEDDEADAVKAAARRVNGADDFDSIADDAAVIRHSNAGKALMDERLLPLPLSPQFMKLVVGETFGSEELSDIFLSHGRILHSMYKASKRLAEGEWDVQIDQMNVEDWLDAVGLTFIDPLSQEPLVAGGEDITVTASNLTLYVRAVLELWLESGIHAQVLAFRDGIGEVLPIGKLRLLFVPELLSLLCGEKDIEWDVASLLKDTKLAHGYTKDSEPVQYFFEVLDEMASAERRAFLLYATGCPNLPLGGFQALKPPFEVVRRVVDNVEVDRALPFARTCTNTLHLPAYSSKALLAKQLAFAVANSRGVIDRD